MAFSLLTSAYLGVTQPLPIVGVAPVDVAGAMRLSVALRQIRAMQSGTSGRNIRPPIENEYRRNLASAYIAVYGGELVLVLLLAHTPSFLTSPTFPLLFLASEALVHFMPPPPAPSLATELPLAVLDAFTRVGLLTSMAFPPVLGHPSPAVAASPLALLLTSTVLANGGFFFVSSASMLSPSGWKLTTPNELKPLGWTAMDLWSASLITALFAVLTNAQPWCEGISDGLGFASDGGATAKSATRSGFDSDHARSVCLGLLMLLFSARAYYNFGSPPSQIVKLKGA